MNDSQAIAQTSQGEALRWMTFYVAFLLSVQSRRIQVIGCTPYSNDVFVIQPLRHATGDTHRLSDGRILLCAATRNEAAASSSGWGTAGVRVARTPPRAPNCNAYAEQFIRL